MFRNVVTSLIQINVYFCRFAGPKYWAKYRIKEAQNYRQISQF